MVENIIALSQTYYYDYSYCTIKCIIFALTGSCIITKLLIKQLWLFGIVDKPYNRRVHQVTMLRGGGLAIVLVIVILESVFEYFFFNQMTGIFKLLPLFLVIALV